MTRGKCSKSENFPACGKNFRTLNTGKHEEEAVCEANQRIPNVFRIAGAAESGGAIRYLGVTRVNTRLREKFSDLEHRKT